MPAAIAVAPEIPATATGLDEGELEPFPSWPKLFNPEHETVPPVEITHVWLPPAAIAVTPTIPSTGTGAGELLVVPSPSCP